MTENKQLITGKLIMCKGLPRSGKSTWAKEFLAKSGNAIIVSRDDLRAMLHNNKWSPRNENITMAVQKDIVARLLKLGKTVIVDDTNLGDYHLARWTQLAHECNSTFTVHHEKEANLTELVRRDMFSSTKRGADVIIKLALANDYVHFPDDSVVVCDLDGTLCDIEHRRHHVLNGNRDWNAFFEGIANDERREIVHSILQGYVDAGKTIIFASGRPEKYRKVTEAWLDKHGYLLQHDDMTLSAGIRYFALLMRPDNDTRQDTLVKQEMLEKYLKKSWIHTVIDDRPSVIRMWKENGLNVIDVGDGIDF